MPAERASIRALSSSATPARSDPAAAVDEYLADRCRIGLEAVLLSASRGMLPAGLAGLAGIVVAALVIAGTTNYRGGGVSKIHEGTVDVLGVTYAAAFEVWTDIDGYSCITDIQRFEPVEWRAGMRLGAAPKAWAG